MKKKKCKICKTLNKENTHYCIKCGNNLSDIIENTDIIFFLSDLFKIAFIVYVLGTLGGIGIVAIFSVELRIGIIYYFVGILLLILAILFRIIGINMCKKRKRNS